MTFVVIVWNGIHSGSVTNRPRLSFHYHRLLYCPDQMQVVVVLNQHRVSSFKTVRPRITFIHLNKNYVICVQNWHGSAPTNHHSCKVTQIQYTPILTRRNARLCLTHTHDTNHLFDYNPVPTQHRNHYSVEKLLKAAEVIKEWEFN